MLTTRALGSAAASRRLLLRAAAASRRAASTPRPSRRFFATTDANANDAPVARGCPFTGTGEQRQQSTVAAAVDAGPAAVELNLNRPTLKKVPSMPIFGSFFIAVPLIGEQLADYHGIPKMTAGNAYDYYPEMRRRFGDLYAKDIPGHGAGPRGTCIVLNDPHEMIKVLRQEGSLPRGGIESLWPFHDWLRSKGIGLAGTGEDGDLGFFGRGDEWRRLRTFMQTDLMNPQAARGYVAGVAEAATVASRGAPAHAGNVNDFLNYAAFDMFNTVFFGNLSNVANPEEKSDPEDDEFCAAAVDSLALMVGHILDQKQRLYRALGIESEMNKKFTGAMDTVHRIVDGKMERFLARHAAGELDEIEKASYLARGIDRLRAEDCEVAQDEFTDLCLLLLNASVDTTSTFIAWALVHLTVNPDVQEKLADEIRRNMDENDGVLSAKILTKKKSPYLHAVLRESHRMTPVHHTTMSKCNSAGPIEVHGIEFAKDSVFTFECLSVGMDPDVVDSPEEFRPERWLPEGLEAMKGTQAEVLDHPFYRDPFSQGARRCPGSRVAVNETLAFLARLVYDWKIAAPEGVRTYRDISYSQQTLLVPQLPELAFTPRN